MTKSIVLSLGSQLARMSVPFQGNLLDRPYTDSIRLFTREQDLVVSRIFLEKMPRFPDSYHLGCGGSHNLDIAALRGSSFVTVVDRDPRMVDFWNAMVGSLERVDSREAFIGAMQRHIHCNLMTENSSYYPPDPRQDFESEVARYGSWLSSEKSFGTIQDLARKGRIAVVTGKLYDERLVSAIAATLRNHGLRPDTVYIGEFPNKIFGVERQSSLWNTIAGLSEDHTALVFSQHIKNLKQEVIQGEHLKVSASGYAFACGWNNAGAELFAGF